MNAQKIDLTLSEAVENLLARYSALSILRALAAHRIGRRRRRRLISMDTLSSHLIRDLGLHEPRAMRQDPASFR